MIKAQPLLYEKDLFTPVLTKEALDFYYGESLPPQGGSFDYACKAD